MATGAESDKERVDRELRELLDEVRVAIPGAEVLFAFLLGVAFTERFAHATSTQRHVYFATLLSTAAATALLIAPSAYHRIRFRDGDKNRMLYTATRMMIGSLILLLLAVSGAVFLVADIMYTSPFAALASALTAAWFVSFWFALPVMRRVRESK
jgi:Family of unknown function (DUF6328)